MRWGCPNWRDAEDYSSSMTLAMCKWEFLRRDTEYREVWGRAKTKVIDMSHLPQEVNKLRRVAIKNDENYLGAVSLGGLVVVDPSASFQVIMDHHFQHQFMPKVEQVHLFKVCSLSDWIRWSKNSPMSEVEVLMGYINQTQGLFDMEREELISVAQFDHTRPLPEQLKRVTKLVKERHKALSHPIEEHRKKPEKWKWFLRILDARDQGATFEEIYEVRAEELSDGDADTLDEFYRANKNARTDKNTRAVAHQWHKDALNVMVKVTRLS